jgi:glucose/mannose-6-phosphate isomerase
VPFARSLAEEWGPAGDEDGEAKRLARALHETVPVIAGAGPAAAAAYRWKCQLNENSSMPAFCAPLPEASHNEVAAWPAARDVGPFSAVFLEDPAADPRDAARSELMAEIAGEGAQVVERVHARGETRLERLVSLVLLGDLVSLYLAVLRGVDPADVEPLDRLKAALTNR